MRKTSILNIFLYIFSFLLGLVAGFLDFTGSEVQLGGFLVFVFAFVSGLIRPNVKTVWIHGVLIGVGVPLMHIILKSYGFKEPNALQLDIVFTAFSFIPGIVGAYIAVFTRRSMEDRNKQIIDEKILDREMVGPNINQETVPEFKSKYNVPKI